jgi:hypothetical protein
VPTPAPGILGAIDAATLRATKALAIPRLLASAEPAPLPPAPGLFEHGVGTKVDSAH